MQLAVILFLCCIWYPNVLSAPASITMSWSIQLFDDCTNLLGYIFNPLDFTNTSFSLANSQTLQLGDPPVSLGQKTNKFILFGPQTLTYQIVASSDTEDQYPLIACLSFSVEPLHYSDRCSVTLGQCQQQGDHGGPFCSNLGVGCGNLCFSYLCNCEGDCKDG